MERNQKTADVDCVVHLDTMEADTINNESRLVSEPRSINYSAYSHRLYEALPHEDAHNHVQIYLLD